MKKSWKNSKTIIFNSLAVAVAAADYITPFIPPTHLPVFLAVIGVSNIALRFVTKEPIK
jgi:hypothetical protein